MKHSLKKILIAAALVCGASLAVGSANSTFASDTSDKFKLSFDIKFDDFKNMDEEQILQKLRSEVLVKNSNNKIDENKTNELINRFFEAIKELKMNWEKFGDFDTKIELIKK